MRVMTSYNSFRPTTGEILALVREKAASHGAVVRDSDVFDDGNSLMVRAVVPGNLMEIRKGDYVSPGFAVRVERDVVSINAFVLRLVCVNGAILPVVAEAKSIERIEVTTLTSSAARFESSVVLNAIAEEVDHYPNADNISEWIALVRKTSEVDGMSILTSGLFLRAMREFRDRDLVADMIGHFARPMVGPRSDNTAFGLLNAITAMGRETRDPDLRWKLEALGGSLPALVARAGVRLQVPASGIPEFAQRRA